MRELAAARPVKCTLMLAFPWLARAADSAVCLLAETRLEGLIRSASGAPPLPTVASVGHVPD